MRDNDVLTITVVQQFTAGILALLLALVTQPMPTMAQVATPEFIGAMTYVAMLSAAFGAVAQNMAQAHLSPSEAGLLCSLESVFCVVFFGEVLTARMAMGFAFIFAAIVATQLGDKGSDAAAAGSSADGSTGGESTTSGKPAKRNRGRIAR